MFCPESFQMMANSVTQVSIILSSPNYHRVYSTNFKKLRSVEVVLFYPENEVMAFPKIERKWYRVSNFHVHIKSDVVIWFWQYVLTGNGLSHTTWSYFLFAQHLEAYLMLKLWWTCLLYHNFFLMLETEESICEIDSHHIMQEAFKLWLCN